MQMLLVNTHIAHRPLNSSSLHVSYLYFEYVCNCMFILPNITLFAALLTFLLALLAVQLNWDYFEQHLSPFPYIYLCPEFVELLTLALTKESSFKKCGKSNKILYPIKHTLLFFKFCNTPIAYHVFSILFLLV